MIADPRLEALFASPVPLDAVQRERAEMLALVVGALRAVNRRGGGPGCAFSVPGRIELFGKHTDYCGGRSLLCAVDRGFVFFAQPNSDNVVRLIPAARGETVALPLAPEIQAIAGHWSNYPATVVKRMLTNFGPLKGIDIAFRSDLPPAAGLSSSSALIIGVFLAIASLNQVHRDPRFNESIHTLEDLAHYCGCIENGSGFRSLTGQAGVGTTGGSQDHTAILCCREGIIGRYGFAPVTHEIDVAFPDHVHLFVINSGVVAEKTGDAKEKYNAVSRKVRCMVELWNHHEQEHAPTLASIVRANLSNADELRSLIRHSKHLQFSAEELLERLDQFRTESETLIPQITLALQRQHYSLLSDLTRASNAAAVKGLKNQVPQTLQIVEDAQASGAIAASPFGAGFGGSVWAIVRKVERESFVRRFAEQSAVKPLLVRPSNGAHQIATTV